MFDRGHRSLLSVLASTVEASLGGASPKRTILQRAGSNGLINP
jgi:hypothetical protein